MNPQRCLVASLIIGLAVVFPVLAVEQTGNLEGTVADERGQPVSSAVLTLWGANLQGTRTSGVDALGRYEFRAIPPGEYALRITAEGHAEVVYEEIVVHLGRTTVVAVDLSHRAIEEHIVVKARRPLIDPVRTTAEANYDRRYLEKAKMGMGARSFQSVLLDTPGTVAGTLTNSQVRGSSATENIYLIDGVNSNDSSFQVWGADIIYDAIEEIQFQTGAFPAEFGRSTGGVANIVTKSGGNEFSGSLDTRFSNASLTGSGEHFDPDETDLKRSFTEATLGGPIKKDKLWFFLAAGTYADDSTPTGSPTTFESRKQSYLGKLTWQVNPAHKLVLQYTGTPLTEHNSDASALVSEEATTERTWDTYFTTARYQGILGQGVIVEAQAAVYRSDLDLLPTSGDLTTSCRTDWYTGVTSVNACSLYYSERDREEISASLTWNKRIGRQAHTFKIGASFQNVSYTTNSSYPGGRKIYEAPDAAGDPATLYYIQGDLLGDAKNEGDLPSFFVQDEWRVHQRVTLNVGLRYDRFSYDNDIGEPVYRASLWQPRLGVAWNIRGDSRDVLKASASRFGHPANLWLPSWTNTAGEIYHVYANETIAGHIVGAGAVPVDINGDGVIEEDAYVYTFGGAGGTEFLRSGRLDAMFVDEHALSYERRLADRGMVGVTVTRRTTERVTEDRVDPDTGHFLIDNLDGVNRRYWGVELRAAGQWKGLDVRGSYTLSRAEGNVGGLWGGLIGLSPEWDDPAEYPWRWGFLSFDARHRLKINGSWSLPRGFAFGFGYFAFSGFPYNVERVYDFACEEREYVGGRGAHRLPSQDQLDVGFTKSFRHRGVDYRLGISVLNLFDKEEVIDVNETEGVAGDPLDHQRPRRYEVGFRVAF